MTLCSDYLLFLASEADNGVNLNANPEDNDTSDDVPYYFSVTAPGIPGINTQIAANNVICDEGYFVMIAPESSHGLDLNNDDDTNDQVPIYVTTSGGVLNFGSPLTSDGPLTLQECPSIVRIFANAGEDSFEDRNDDGDTEDHFVHVLTIDRATGSLISDRALFQTDEEGNSQIYIVDGESVAFKVQESITGGGRDANGDGDTADDVLYFVKTTCY